MSTEKANLGPKGARPFTSIYSDDIPADYIRHMLNLPDDYPVVSRVDQIRETYGRPK